MEFHDLYNSGWKTQNYFYRKFYYYGTIEGNPYSVGNTLFNDSSNVWVNLLEKAFAKYLNENSIKVKGWAVRLNWSGMRQRAYKNLSLNLLNGGMDCVAGTAITGENYTHNLHLKENLRLYLCYLLDTGVSHATTFDTSNLILDCTRRVEIRTTDNQIVPLYSHQERHRVLIFLKSES